MSRLAELISRLEAAESGSRELDALIAAEIEPHLFDSPGFPAERPIPPFIYDKGENVIRFDGGGLMDVRFFPPVTSSLDDAIALADRKCPGLDWALSKSAAHIFAGVDIFTGKSKNGAIALCIAILKSLQEPRQ